MKSVLAMGNAEESGGSETEKTKLQHKNNTKQRNSIQIGEPLRQLVSGKKEVVRTQRAINYRLSPIFGFMQHIKREYTLLIDLLLHQAGTVGDMGLCVARMAEVCKYDQADLFDYYRELEGRIKTYETQSSTLEHELATRLASSRQGEGKSIEELEETIQTLELRYDCRNIGLAKGDANRYLSETGKLLESTTQLYKDLEGIAQRFCGVGVHLNRTSIVLGHKIEIGAQSKALHDIFRTIRQNNERAVVEINHGVHSVKSLLHGVSLSDTYAQQSDLTPERYLQQGIKRAKLSPDG